MQIAPRCYAVTGLGYTPPWYVNAGFVVGDGITLVADTGANWMAGATVHGYASAVRPSNQIRVINTEKHFDHIGGNGYFVEKGCEVWGHPGIVRTPEEFLREVDECNAAIPNPIRRQRGEARDFFRNTRPVNPTRPVDTGVEWDLGGLAAHLLLTPGHTRTNLCVWLPDQKVLYAGDSLIHGYLANLEDGGPADWSLWLASLDRIESLDAAVVVCGHGPVAFGDDVPRIVNEVRRTLLAAIRSQRAPTVPAPA